LALFLAIERDKTEVVEMLIKGGVPGESRDFDGRTPLHRAAVKRNAALVKFLIEHEAKVDVKDFKEETPWVLAAREGYYEGKSRTRALVAIAFVDRYSMALAG
jgi:ankyrin repeat protein